MAQYVYIENYNKLGTMAFSKTVFEQIVHIVTDNAMNQSSGTKAGKKRITLNSPARISIRNGQVLVNVDVTIAKGENVAILCKSLQEEIANALTAQTEMVPFRVDIRVVSVK